MCIIVAKPANKEITRETLQQCWTRNSDGAGFMYNHEGRLRVKKGFFDFQSFYDSFMNSTEGKKAVAHFRITTHGKTDMPNCHPFRINEHLAFAHNGIISQIATTDKDKSDTWHFNERILKPLTQSGADLFGNNAVCELIRGYIGSSKLVFLNSNNDIFIMNERMGEWEDGVWFSNTSYKTYNSSQNTNVVPHKRRHRAIRNKVAELKTGTLVEFSVAYDKIPVGTLGEITTVNSNYSANLEIYDKKNDITYERFNIPFYCIEPLSVDGILEYYENVGG